MSFSLYVCQVCDELSDDDHDDDVLALHCVCAVKLLLLLLLLLRVINLTAKKLTVSDTCYG